MLVGLPPQLHAQSHARASWRRYLHPGKPTPKFPLKLHKTRSTQIRCLEQLLKKSLLTSTDSWKPRALESTVMPFERGRCSQESRTSQMPTRTLICSAMKRRNTFATKSPTSGGLRLPYSIFSALCVLGVPSYKAWTRR